MAQYEIESRFNKSYSIITRRIVRMLSENARLSVTEMSKQLGVSRPTIKEKIRRLESELGMHYTIELDEGMLGLNYPHLIAIRFNKKPDYAKVKELLLKSCIPQVAFSVDGDYNMVIYANALSGGAYAHWDKAMRILLGGYGAVWEPSEVMHRQLGFFPLRNETIERTNLDTKSKEMLKLLNENSRLSFQQLSKRLGMHFNTVKYNFDKLFKQGYIKRTTISMDMVKNISFLTFFANYTPAEGYESSSARARLAVFYDDQDPLISRYLISAPLIGSHDLFALLAFDDKATAYRYNLSYHKSLFVKHGIKMIYGEVKEVVLGRLPIRSMDTRKVFNKIIWSSDLSE